MNDEKTSRTRLLIGDEAARKLNSAHIALFGCGGVGGYALEALARAGVGEFTLIDNDVISESNFNRQIIATEKTLGMKKVEAARARVLEINSEAVVHAIDRFVLLENIGVFDFSAFDYVVDAIDTVSAKIALAVACEETGTPIISAMGAGNKLDPTRFEVADISKTSVCPLAKVMRTSLRRRGVKHLKVVYSKEEPIKVSTEAEGTDSAHGRRNTPGSISFVPSAAGLIIAGELVKDIIKKSD